MARGRRGRPPRATRSVDTPEETEEVDVSGAPSEMEVDEDEEIEVDGDGGDDEEEGDGEGGDDEENDDPDEEEPEEQPAEEVPQVPVKRGRGRPKGSGSGKTKPRVPTGRPRGRPKGKGRPRGQILVRIGEGDEGDDDVRQVLKFGDDTFLIENDEFVTPDNPKGDAKVDSDGNLLGGRQFKAPTFTIPSRHPTRKYMLAIDAARTSGFKDSLYYFRRNPLMLKLNLSQGEKDKLIDDGKLSTHLRSRSVTLVTARSAYKLHGAKMIKDGRWIIDDYDEEKVLPTLSSIGAKPGDPVGDLADPSVGPTLSKLTFTAPTTSSGLAIYRPGAPSTIFGGSGLHPFSREHIGAGNTALGRIAGLAREGVTPDNWMMEAARRTWEANERFKKARKERLGVVGVGGVVVYKKAVVGEEAAAEVAPQPTVQSGASKPVMGWVEPHTDTIHYRKDTQPTSAQWETLTTPAPELASAYPLLKPKFRALYADPSSLADDDTPESRAARLESTRITGGTKVGQGAWGVAVVRTCLEGGRSKWEIEERRERARLKRLAEKEAEKRSILILEDEGEGGPVIQVDAPTEVA